MMTPKRKRHSGGEFKAKARMMGNGARRGGRGWRVMSPGKQLRGRES